MFSDEILGLSEENWKIIERFVDVWGWDKAEELLLPTILKQYPIFGRIK